LLNYRRNVNVKTGNTSFEPWRENQHDDVLFATCLGVWAFERVITKVEHIDYHWEIVQDAPAIVYGGP
jgi:hypothetical protein